MQIEPYKQASGTYNNRQRIPAPASEFSRTIGLSILGTAAPDEVKEAWNKAEKETGVNGMAMNSKGMLTQITKLFVMSLESKQNGGRQDILGNTVSSARTAVQNALNRLGTPQNHEEKKEKLFYEAFLHYLG